MYLGNLDAQRDWGHAKDYVNAMWLMLQQENPDDFVIATGVMHTVRNLAVQAFKCIDVELTFKGSGKDEVGYIKSNNGPYNIVPGQEVILIDPNYYRPTEVEELKGDASKAKNILGWEPTISFDSLIKEMVEADLKLASTN